MKQDFDALAGASWQHAELLQDDTWLQAGDVVSAIDRALAGTIPENPTIVAVSARDPGVAAILMLRLQSVGHDVIVAGSARRLAVVEQFAYRHGAAVMPAVELALACAPEAQARVYPIEACSARLPAVDGRLIFATSGSTGEPKLVGFDRTQVRFLADTLTKAIGYRRSDMVASALPISFDYGFYQVVLALHAGCRLITGASMSLPRQTLDLLAGRPVTVLPVTPAFARGMIAAAAPDESFHHVRLITSTGAPFAGSLQERLRGLFPQSEMLPMYGLTECKRVAISTPALSRSQPDSVGVPLTGTTVRILDDSGTEVSAGVAGEAVVTGPHVAHGYYADSAHTGSLRSESDGTWSLYTGDLMRCQADGALFHLGRIQRDFVKVLDERVSLLAIEEALRGLSAVAEARAAPVYDDQGLVERIDVEVVASPAFDAGAARRRVRRDVSAAAASRLTIRNVSSIVLSDHGKVAGP